MPGTLLATVSTLLGPAGRDRAVRILVEIFERAERDRPFYALLADDTLAAALAPKLTRALSRHLVGDAHRPPSAPDTGARAALRAHLHAGIVVNTIAWTMQASQALTPRELAEILADEFFESGH